MQYPREMIGYGRTPPAARWPGGARVALQFVVNYEEGGENCILHGDPASEAFLSEIVGAQPWPGQRHMNMESIYEYGSRAGFWRVWRLFAERKIPVTVFGVATALQRNPEAVTAMLEADWEIACHGLKWIDYRDHSREAEAADMDAAIALHTKITGNRPQGWYTGRSSIHTLDLAMERDFEYLSDSYADDVPYWLKIKKKSALVVPYTLDANDMRFATAQGFNSGEQFYNYLCDSFDVLYAEGRYSPKMMSVGLHCRLVGRPGRLAALTRFLDYVSSYEDVWIARRVDIARHWRSQHPIRLTPSQMDEKQFVQRFGNVFEDTPEIAARAWRQGLTSEQDTVHGLHDAMVRVMRSLPRHDQLALILNHPELAGRLALAGQLSAASTSEQSSAGLGSLTAAELETFTKLNDAYHARFGIPFIMAIRGRSKDEILAAFEMRLHNEEDQEIEEALRQIERIALLRLKDLLPLVETE